MRKRLLAIIATAAMVVAMVPSMVFAAGGSISGAGTAANPYLIEDAADLKAFRDAVNSGNNYAGKYVKLVNNINLNNEEWTPIGDTTYNGSYKPVDTTKVFSGVFDGNDKVISNLKIKKMLGTDPDDEANVGLFSITGAGAVIEDLTITNVNIEASGRNVGALVGYAYNATMKNITVNGKINISGGNNVSGVFGMSRYHDASATNITVSGAEGSVISGNNIVGGITAEIAPNGANQTFNNLNVENIKINGVGGVGSVVGLLTKGTISNVSVKNVELTGRTDYKGDDMGRIRLGSVVGLLGSTTSKVSNVTVENVTGKNLTGSAVNLPVVGANYDAATADGVELNATEAKIGDSYYATVQIAIDAAKDGDIIEVLAVPLAKIENVTKDVTFVNKTGETIMVDGEPLAPYVDPSVPATPSKPQDSPNTGDNSMAPIAVAGLALAAMAAVAATRRRTN